METVFDPKRDRNDDLKLIGEAFLVGVLAGGIAVLYRFLLHGIERFLRWFPPFVTAHPLYIVLMFFVLIGIGLVVYDITRFEPLCGGSGIPQVRAEMKGYVEQRPLRILSAKIIGGVLSIFSGLSVGREGPSIQMGAMAGKGISRLLKRRPTTEKYLMSCGASAGLAAAFNAPVAGVLFALEEIHHHFSRKLLITGITATVTADYISKLFGGIRPVFHLPIKEHIPFEKYGWILLLGVIVSLLGAFYLGLMKLFHRFYDTAPLPKPVKAVLPFVVSGCMILVFPSVLGGGDIMFQEVLQHTHTVQFLLLLLLIKLVFSLFSFTSGIPGGIFFPILILGATTGVIYSQMVSPSYMGSFAILAMAGFLTAVVRAPMTSILLIFEMTGNLSYLLPLSVVCLIAYAMMNALSSRPVYDYLLFRLLKRGVAIDENKATPVLLNVSVQPGSCLAGRDLATIGWPKEALIVKIERGVQAIVPNGDTVIREGDQLQIVVAHNKLADVEQSISGLCRNVLEGAH